MHYTPKQAGDYLSCSEDQIRSLIAGGELLAANIGVGKQRKRWRISQDALDAFLARRTAAGLAASS